jgi:3-oxoacyl-[acyl-carrier-protein] synthase III
MAEYDERSQICVHDIFSYHHKPELGCTLENVGLSGEFRGDVTEGRIVNPGHDIECSWFLMEYANHTGDKALHQKAENVFNFAINETPAMVEELLQASGKKVDDIDYFVCHQPNPFMLKKMAEKIGVTQDRLPNDIVPKYGNSNSATIPVTLCEHYQEMYAEQERLTLCLASFGAGLSLGGVIMEMPRLDHCQMLNYPHQS